MRWFMARWIWRPREVLKPTPNYYLIDTNSSFPLLFCHQHSIRRRLATKKALKQELIRTRPHEIQQSNLDEHSNNYSRTVFSDRATITIFAGSGGHGCISFLREKYIKDGPPNGGDGGTGGNVYIQALWGETSLHKLARRNILRAGRGRNGKGKSRGGERGKDVVIQVPVGTVVREIERVDPFILEEQNRQPFDASQENSGFDGDDATITYNSNNEKWLLHPTINPKDVTTAKFPKLPRGRKSALATIQASSPIFLDLNKPMEAPLLLAAGAVGGLGNPHFVTQMVPKPKYATKGEEGMKLKLELELKLLADVGLVGHPNAGKSTLLRALSKSRARVGDWAFTTLQPNIGTAVLDDYKSRPIFQATCKDGEPRTNFTIADIPGLVRDAHLDRGLGISFLRHVERARVLAFVIDLSVGDAIVALKSLWREVMMYECMKIQEARDNSLVEAHWSPFKSPQQALANLQETIIIRSRPTPIEPENPRISAKPWFVVATKADLPETEENFKLLSEYLEMVNQKIVQHPSQREKFWSKTVTAIPVSAINGLGTSKIISWINKLLDD